MPLNIDLGSQSTQTIDASNAPQDGVVDLTLASNGTLIFDNVTAQIASIAGINGASATTIEAINGANVTVNAGLLGIGVGSTFTYDIGAGSQITFDQPTIGLGLGNATTIHFDNTGGTGLFTFVPNVVNIGTSFPTITGLSTGDRIDVIGATGATLSGGVLTFTYPGLLGSSSVSFNVAGTPAGASVTFDAHTGIAVFACFLRGTRVATPKGEIAIETLRPGDEVLTLNGGRVAIKWIGRRTLEPGAIHPPQAALPVRLSQHALAANIPHRDLFLSPDHSLYIDGALIPVKLLINGKTIVQENRTEPFEYFHIELERHDVIMVEGALAETYIDMGNRHMFGAPGIVHIHLDARRGEWCDYCYPPLYGGPVFDGIVARLAAQAASLGYEPQIHALAS